VQGRRTQEYHKTDPRTLLTALSAVPVIDNDLDGMRRSSLIKGVTRLFFPVGGVPQDDLKIWSMPVLEVSVVVILH
jgi:hypothetical protein